MQRKARVNHGPTGKEPSKPILVTAFFVPLIVAAAYLNMGQSSCGGGGGTCDSWGDTTHRRYPCSPRVFKTTRSGGQEVTHEALFVGTSTTNERLAVELVAPPITLAATGDVREVSWRGDPVLELELLGGPAVERASDGAITDATNIWAESEAPLPVTQGYAISIPWNRGSLADQVADVDVLTVAETFFGLEYSTVALINQAPLNVWPGAHTARLVDRGWCSGMVPWKGKWLNAEYVPGIADYLRSVFYLEFANILGQAPDESIKGISVISDYFMPGIIVRGTGQAGFEFRPKIRIWGEGPFGNSRGADVEFTLWVTLNTGSAGQILATVDVFDFEVSNGELAGPSIEASLAELLPELDDLSALLTEKLADAPFAVRRMIARPSGLELVLAETLNDEQRPTVQLAAVLGDVEILGSPGSPGLPIDIACQYHEQDCPGCTRPDPADLKATHYGKFRLPDEEQWFPIIGVNHFYDSCGGPVFENGHATVACVRVTGLGTNFVGHVPTESAPVGTKLKVCYYDLESLAAQVVQMPWVIDSGYFPGDPYCGEMGGSVIIRKVDP